ncbi:MAG: hypothetical protein JSU01_16865 [Bacteroidetes bacterium]|nr:hypothetical protein [Bacteroidota bacterium]
MDEFENVQPENEKSAIYSKWAIILFSIFFSPFVGSVLLMLNLRRIGNKTAGYLVLVFGIAYVLVENIVIAKLTGGDIGRINLQKTQPNDKLLYYTAALNVFGGAVLVEYFFRRHFKPNSYITRSALPALIIVIAISFLLVSLLAPMIKS